MSQPTVRDTHVDTLLSAISIAYRNPSYIAEQVFPRVPVQKKSDYYFQFGKDAWQRNEVAIRAPGTQAQRGDYTVTSASYNALTYAIATTIPDEVRANADAPLNPDLNASDWVTDQLLRAQELRVANKTTGGSGLWVYSATPSIAWSNDSSDPWGDIDAAINGVVGSIGNMPNTMVLSWSVWRHLRQHPDFMDRVKYTREGGRVELSDLSNWFNIDKVLLGTQLYDPAREGATASPTQIWGNGVWLGYVPATPALMTPAAGYVFEWQARQVSRFRDDVAHTDIIEAQHSVAEVISASDAGAVLYGCV